MTLVRPVTLVRLVSLVGLVRLVSLVGLMGLVTVASTTMSLVSLVSTSMAVAMIVSHMAKSSLARGCQSHRYSGHLLKNSRELLGLPHCRITICWKY